MCLGGNGNEWPDGDPERALEAPQRGQGKLLAGPAVCVSTSVEPVTSSSRALVKGDSEPPAGPSAEAAENVRSQPREHPCGHLEAWEGGAGGSRTETPRTFGPAGPTSITEAVATELRGQDPPMPSREVPGAAVLACCSLS